MCSRGCIKYLLFFFNLVFALSGLALIIIGAVQIANTSDFSDLLDDIGAGMKGPQIFIIVVGVIIFFIATLGCCGAVQESRCMLASFAILLLSIFIVELAVGIYALNHKAEYEMAIEKGLEHQFRASLTDNKVRKVFEGMEKELQCCGVKGSGDYSSSSRATPPSCCSDKSGCQVTPNAYWQYGCLQALTQFTGKAGIVLGAAAITLSVLELFGAVFALMLTGRRK